MKKIALLLPLLLLACQKKEVAVVPSVQTPQAEATQPTDALDSAMIAKLVQINPAEPWNNAKAYKAGEVIRFNNETWIAIRPGYQNTPPPDEWFWHKVTSSSTAAVSTVAKETSTPAPVDTSAKAEPKEAVSTAKPYDMNREYKIGEVVSFNGKTFVAKRAVFLNTNPSDSWFWEEK